MNATEKHILSAQESINAIFDKLLADVRSNAAFIAEINATHDPEEVGEYTATIIVEAPPSVPDLSDVKPFAKSTANVEESRRNPNGAELLNELADRMDLEQTGETALSSINDDLWLRFVKTIMLAGWSLEKLKASEPCKNIIFTKTENELLENLVALRYTMKGKDIDLNGALGQDWVTPIEAGVIKQFAKENKLK